MNILSLIPQRYSDALAVSAPPLSSAQICVLNQEFLQWQQAQFPVSEVTSLVAARAHYVDLTLTKLWCQHHLDEYQISLVAVGGYGRRELHPYSDVDILLLTQDEIADELAEKISAFITQLWDVKLDIGHSVRSIKECLNQAIDDVTIATNLLEMRQICGNQALVAQLQPLLIEDIFWTSEKFFIAKRDEQYQRHQQYHGASYTLEPNLKSNPGGLRDIQTIAWVAKRHFMADTLEQLIDHHYLTSNEFFELLECQDYLWRMRCALHFIAGRNENRLLFDYQADVAEIMGFGDGGKLAIERMMKRFFRIISRVSELNRMLLQHFEYAILNEKKHSKEIVLNDDFVIIDGQIKVCNKRVFTRSTMIMEMFLLIAQHKEITDLHPETLRLMRNARRRLVSGMVDYERCREIFIALIKHPRGLGLPFTLMHRHSIIGAYLPLWRNIVGQMQFDLFHAYSVDEHSYRLLKNLYRFSQPRYNHEYPLCSKIVQRIRKPELLYFAGIFHDIAKGRGGDHAKLGAIDALDFAKVHKLSDHDGRMIAWLVKKHLLMSVTAQRRDISDPEVIKAFAEVVRDEAHLDYLYCLTVADMRATNESLWNSWKANLLEDLYYSTKRAFRRGLEKPVDLRAKIRENQQQAREILQQEHVDQAHLTQLWKEFKADYFLRYAPEQIAWHFRHILAHDKTKPLVIISPKPYRGGTEVFVYTKDKPNIFFNIVSLLGAKKLSIHDAKITTNKSGYTANTFVVLDNRNKAINDSARALSIARSLASRLAAKQIRIKAKPIAKRFRQFKVPTHVSFIESTTKNSTMLEIVALDHPGLLANIAAIFQKCKIQIHSAKITTFGEKAEDVFTISNSDNQALTKEQEQALAAMLCADSHR
ncbi:UTP--GlnB (protein PII) uridylyltransferase, GlnD [Colwellia chukchiensis]|uniref:Bifunctional uridylyltransferase/uridylyl-removing enzyme n=1 Tax=Colwellia chukchiensis TaxID=641665 RepID=A0A1H7K911_9GAMM|nr:[protein-PII] uridylyltransferase [Colwellia chukchiensis]SEK82946.1 UTP--GlnB (protein PII) uridylyltransferase, GlnD [Colwellia chukchiensis]